LNKQVLLYSYVYTHTFGEHDLWALITSSVTRPILTQSPGRPCGSDVYVYMELLIRGSRRKVSRPASPAVWGGSVA